MYIHTQSYVHAVTDITSNKQPQLDTGRKEQVKTSPLNEQQNANHFVNMSIYICICRYVCL